MKQYEYKVVSMSQVDYNNKLQKLYPHDDRDERASKFLNQFGELGWILCNRLKYTNNNEEYVHFTFIRPKE